MVTPTGAILVACIATRHNMKSIGKVNAINGAGTGEKGGGKTLAWCMKVINDWVAQSKFMHGSGEGIGRCEMEI
jgi:hypothetical protein